VFTARYGLIPYRLRFVFKRLIHVFSLEIQAKEEWNVQAKPYKWRFLQDIHVLRNKAMIFDVCLSIIKSVIFVLQDIDISIVSVVKIFRIKVSGIHSKFVYFEKLSHRFGGKDCRSCKNKISSGFRIEIFCLPRRKKC